MRVGRDTRQQEDHRPAGGDEHVGQATGQRGGGVDLGRLARLQEDADDLPATVSVLGHLAVVGAGHQHGVEDAEELAGGGGEGDLTGLPAAVWRLRTAANAWHRREA